MATAAGQRPEHLDPARVDAPRAVDERRAGRRDGEVRRLDERRGTVVERGVGDLEAREARHHRLVLEQRLQHALGDFGLVRGVGGDELRPGGERPDDGGDLVVVGAAPGEADRAGDDGAVLRRDFAERGHEIGLAERLGQVETRQSDRRGDRGVELVEVVQTQELEHRGDVRVGVGNEAPHGPP